DQTAHLGLCVDRDPRAAVLLRDREPPLALHEAGTAAALDPECVSLGRLLVRDREPPLVDALDGGDADRECGLELIRGLRLEALTPGRRASEHAGIGQRRPDALPRSVEEMGSVERHGSGGYGAAI